MSTEVIMVAGWRTPFGRNRSSVDGGGATGFGSSQPIATLAARPISHCAEHLAHSAGLAPDLVILGCTRGPGGNIARVAALTAALPESLPAWSLDMQCGSGQTAIHAAADAIASGQAEIVIAGGVDSITWAPITQHRGAAEPYTRAAFAPTGMSDPDMGPAADAVAQRFGISRADQDAYAAESWRRVWHRHSSGEVDLEYAHPLPSAASHADPATADLLPSRDERPRRMKLTTLQRLKPAFGAEGTVTAGNSCADVDGAAAVVLMSRERWERTGLPGIRLLSWTMTAGTTAFPGAAAGPAVTAACRRANIAPDELDRLEVTEAFSSQVLATTAHLGWDGVVADRERVNPHGGAIALGHPWAASGASLAVRLLHTRGAERRVASTCAIGGGQGVAWVGEWL